MQLPLLFPHIPCCFPSSVLPLSVYCSVIHALKYVQSKQEFRPSHHISPALCPHIFMSYTSPHIICSLPCVFAFISPISAVSVVSHICDLLILHSFALPLFSRVHAFAPYFFCSFPCKVNAMGTPYESTGARCSSIRPSCRPKEPDVVTRAGC